MEPALRENEEKASLRILFMTVYTMKRVREKTRNLVFLRENSLRVTIWVVTCFFQVEVEVEVEDHFGHVTTDAAGPGPGPQTHSYYSPLSLISREK